MKPNIFKAFRNPANKLVDSRFVAAIIAIAADAFRAAAIVEAKRREIAVQWMGIPAAIAFVLDGHWIGVPSVAVSGRMNHHP
jgi:hypothetical protein